MPRAQLLDEDEIRQGLGSLAGWRREGHTLQKRFTFTGFAEALAFVNEVAVPAEQQDHHPDVFIHWNEVTLSLWTHASGGLTSRDIELAKAIDRITEA